MASIRREIPIAAGADAAWAALRDFGQVHRRVVPGFVTDCRLDGDDRIVTFANGLVARERLVDCDDAARRLAYSATGGRLSHHNGSVQVLTGSAGVRIVWVIDLLPDDLAPVVAAMMDDGARAMQQTLGSGPA